jgi:hypothetical protein
MAVIFPDVSELRRLPEMDDACALLFLMYWSLWLTPPLFWVLWLLLFCCVWYFAEVYQLILDLFTGESPLQRTERDRELEGRLFDPQHRLS